MTGLDFAVDPPAPSPEGEALARRTEAMLRRVHDDNNLERLYTQSRIQRRRLEWTP